MVDLGRVWSGRLPSPVGSTEVECRLRSGRWSGRVGPIVQQGPVASGRVEVDFFSGELGSRSVKFYSN